MAAVDVRHLGFDLLASLASAAMTIGVYRFRLREAAERVADVGAGYALCLVGGAVLLAFGLGTLNLHLSGQPGVGRSALGALMGGITGVELLKWRRGVRGSTGLLFVPAFCTSVVIGRLGCFAAGLSDFTYGVATTLPWGVDLGDGVSRHPVQLYESAAMLAFLLYALHALRRRSPLFLRHGFYLMTGYYALQRFMWESLKPYAAVAGPLNVFHLACVALLAYSAAMLGGVGFDRSAA